MWGRGGTIQYKKVTRQLGGKQEHWVNTLKNQSRDLRIRVNQTHLLRCKDKQIADCWYELKIVIGVVWQMLDKWLDTLFYTEISQINVVDYGYTLC